jgi:hypothetical protein
MYVRPNANTVANLTLFDGVAWKRCADGVVEYSLAMKNPSAEVEEVAQTGIRGMIGALKSEKFSPDLMINALCTSLVPRPRLADASAANSPTGKHSRMQFSAPSAC